MARAQTVRAGTDPTPEVLAKILRALADPTRLRILSLLRQGEICVCHLYEALRLPQPTVSRHLAYLRRHGLVRTRRAGVWIYYSLPEGETGRAPSLLRAALDLAGQSRKAKEDRRRLTARLGCCPSEESVATPAESG